jgi:hypothetical protein
MARIILTFNDQPSIDDSVQINAQFIETFKASRTTQGEVAIGALLSDTLNNFSSAITSDYGGVFTFTTTIDGNVLTIDFPNDGVGFFDIVINSDVITYQAYEVYFPYFRSNYSNLEDSFEIIVFGKDDSVVEENINATAVLSYKDIDNVLEPIRGGQLDIDIDANIDKPFNLFLDIREKDFKVEFYRNGNIIFEGFVNPEGISQPYTTINWKARITVFDNLGSLKNKEIPYTNQFASEFVFMDLCLKETGLDLPIAFFDDINQSVIINNIIQPYGAKLEKAILERFIDPRIYKNDNDRFQDCETILKDILQKYNATLYQQSINFYNSATGQNEEMLCWLFCRVPLLSLSGLTNQQSNYKVKKITGYVDDNGVGIPQVEEYDNLSFRNPTLTLGTDGQTGLDVIHKNRNQLLRQTRALRAFRFVQEWKDIPNLFDVFSKDLFTYIGSSLYSDLFYTLSNVNDAVYFKGESQLLTWTNNFDPTLNIDSTQANAFVELIELELPNGARNLKIQGAGEIFEVGGLLNLNIYAGIQFQALHIAPSGNRYWLVSPAGSNDNDFYVVSQFLNNQKNTFDQSNWILDSEILPDALGNLKVANVSNTLFNFYGQNLPVNAQFSADLPTLQEDGGTVKIYLSPFYIRNVLFDLILEPMDFVRFKMTDFKVQIISPVELGKGEFHDSVNAIDVSSKVAEPINIINADDLSEIYLNGLERKKYPFNAVNTETEVYPYWTSEFDKTGKRKQILELTSIERIRLFSKSQNIFSGDINGYIPYFTRIVNTAYPPTEISAGNFGVITFTFVKWVYDTVNNTIEAEMMETLVLNPSVNYEKIVIFENEERKLIDSI